MFTESVNGSLYANFNRNAPKNQLSIYYLLISTMEHEIGFGGSILDFATCFVSVDYLWI